jgi:hypothetical protein
VGNASLRFRAAYERIGPEMELAFPNACATLWLPTDIFDFDVMPSAAGPIKHVKGGVEMPMSPDK